MRFANRTISYNVSREGKRMPRSAKSREAIKDALLRLLGEKQLDAVTMTELAAQAQVSRSTLYAHYPNVNAVFEDAVTDFCNSLRLLSVQMRCTDCMAAPLKSKPFCIALREAGKYQHLVRDSRFMSTLMEHLDLISDDAFYDSVPSDHADLNRALRTFQMSGCYAVALDTPPEADWRRIQEALDAFIANGRKAL